MVVDRVPLWVRLSRRFGRRVYLVAKSAAWLLVSVLAGVVQEFELADVVGFVRSAVADSARAPLLVGAVVAIWLTIRAMTTGPKGFSARVDLDEGA